ncbi:hypothetical protein [Brevibacterium oceani]|uniref:hypothetical protein n=1 Tax=Brevibacterium oceani TaxID=358099 RepID=UPI0015E760E3|nr:hypothetical protein [Brevibacterium oceani]
MNSHPGRFPPKIQTSAGDSGDDQSLRRNLPVPADLKHGQRRKDDDRDPTPQKGSGGGGRLGEDDEQTCRAQQHSRDDHPEHRQGAWGRGRARFGHLGGTHPM